MQWFPKAQSEITRSCITYMSYDIFKSGHCKTDMEFEERLDLLKLYDYAARNWGHHARDASTLIKEVVSFLSSEEKLEASSQALTVGKRLRPLQGYSQWYTQQVSGVHLAAYFGLCDTLISLLVDGHDPELKDANGDTALSWTRKEWQYAVVKLLIDTVKVNVDSKERSLQ